MELFKILGRIAIDGVDEAKKSVGEVAQDAEKSESKISAAFKKIGTAVVTYFAVDKIKSFGAECVSMASDVEEMENKFNVVFDGMTDEVDTWATDYAEAIGRNRNTIKGYLADNQNMFVGMGMTRDEGAKLSEQMVSLALDLASFNNLNETDAVNAFSKAIMGETESAKSLGAVLNENTRAMAMEQLGYEGKFEALTEAQKMEVNYQAILNQSADAVGDCERSLDSYKGRQIQATAAVENLKEKIGKYLLPVMTKFQEAIAKVANWLSNHLDPAVEFLKQKFEAFKVIAQGVGEYVAEKFEPIFEDLLAIFENIKKAIQPFIDSLADYVSSGKLAEDVTDRLKMAFDALCVAIGFVVNILKKVSEWCLNNKSTVEDIALVVGSFAAAWVAVNTAIGIWNTIGAIATAVTTGFAAAVAFLTSPIGIAVIAIGALIAIVVLLIKHWDDVKEAAQICWDAIKDAFASAANWFDSHVISPIVSFFTNAYEKITSTFSGIAEWFGGIFSNAYDVICDFFAPIGDFFQGVWDTITGIFKNVGETIGNAIESTVAVAVNTILSTACDLINGFIKAINSAISIINKIPKVNISKLDYLEAPELEEGGILEKGQVGLLEGNGAEAVVPLDQNQRWISKVAEDMNNAINNQGGTASNKTLEEILELMKMMMNNLPDVLADSLSRGVKFDVDKREFGRLVRQVNA